MLDSAVSMEVRRGEFVGNARRQLLAERQEKGAGDNATTRWMEGFAAAGPLIN